MSDVNTMRDLIKVMEGAKSQKPEIVEKLEEAFNVKFQGPFSDGREWDALIRVSRSKPIDVMAKVGEIGATLANLGITKNSDMYRTTFSLKADKNTHLAVEFEEKGISLFVHIS